MIKLICRKCGKKGIPLFKKLIIRKNRNVCCEECLTEYNYSWWVGILINFLAALLGSLLFYLVFVTSLANALFFGFLTAAFFIGFIMLFMPLREIKNRGTQQVIQGKP